MKKGEWMILEQDENVAGSGMWRIWKHPSIKSTHQGKAWIRKNGMEGVVYMIVTCRAKVRCTKRPVDKFETVCEEVE